MLLGIFKIIIWIILSFSFRIPYIYPNLILIYRTYAISIYKNHTINHNNFKNRNLTHLISNSSSFQRYLIPRSYFFVNNTIKYNKNDIFKLYVTKEKLRLQGKGKPKSSKSSPKGRDTKKVTSKTKDKKLSKSKLGALKAMQKNRKKKVKTTPIMGRSKVTLEDEDIEDLEKEYERRIALTDTPAYKEKIKMDLYTDDSKPFMTLFDSEKITKDDLLGFDMPYGLVPKERYELMKLCGRVCDPLPPFSSQSLTTRMFNQRLFGKEYEISRDDFNHKIEYKMKFYIPGYGEIFFMDKIRSWRAWYLTRDCKYGPEDLPTYTTIYPIERPPDNVPISHVMLAVNCEINRQGVHPALLDMFWNFFTDDPKVLTRDLVTYKLNWLTDRLENRDPEEGISPDNFYRIFYEAAKESLEKFDEEEFFRGQLRNMHDISTHKMMLMNNKALRVRNKIMREAYNEDLRNLYKTPVPRTYTRYERCRLAGYFNMLDHMREMHKRRKAFPKVVKPVMTPEEYEEKKYDILIEKEMQKQMIEDRRNREEARRIAKRPQKKKRGGKSKSNPNKKKKRIVTNKTESK